MFWNRDSSPTGKVFGGNRMFRSHNFAQRSLRDDFTAARPRPRSEIDNVIGRADSFFVVFDHDDGISEIA